MSREDCVELVRQFCDEIGLADVTAVLDQGVMQVDDTLVGLEYLDEREEVRLLAGLLMEQIVPMLDEWRAMLGEAFDAEQISQQGVAASMTAKTWSPIFAACVDPWRRGPEDDAARRRSPRGPEPAGAFRARADAELGRRAGRVPLPRVIFRCWRTVPGGACIGDEGQARRDQEGARGSARIPPTRAQTSSSSALEERTADRLLGFR